jgi:CobQ-like glutamine amidotransferase family enzyme
VKLRVGHLYPEYLNIYADRGNIAVLETRARLRGHELELVALGLGAAIPSGRLDLVYIGGGQDREQGLVAGDLAAKAPALIAAAAGGTVVLGVCGGYQLLGRRYRDPAGVELPGVGLLPLETVAGARRMIGDVLVECEWAGERLAGFENHGGRTLLDADATPLGAVVHGFGNDGSSGFEGARAGRVYGTYLHGPLLPRNPWFADLLLAQALEHAAGEPLELAPLPDALEHAAYRVAAARAASRGGQDAAAEPGRRPQRGLPVSPLRAPFGRRRTARPRRD